MSMYQGGGQMTPDGGFGAPGLEERKRQLIRKLQGRGGGPGGGPGRARSFGRVPSRGPGGNLMGSLRGGQRGGFAGINAGTHTPSMSGPPPAIAQLIALMQGAGPPVTPPPPNPFTPEKGYAPSPTDYFNPAPPPQPTFEGIPGGSGLLGGVFPNTQPNPYAVPLIQQLGRYGAY